MRKILLSLVLVLSAAACGGAPKLDGSSQAAFEASLERVREPLDERKKIEFDSAIMAMSLTQLGEAIATARSGGDVASGEARDAELRAALDGLTADEVIAKAQPARRDLLEKTAPR